jgi:hypothetical protein
MFSVVERTEIRGHLIALAEADPRVIGAALAGSAARGTEDAHPACAAVCADLASRHGVAVRSST